MARPPHASFEARISFFKSEIEKLIVQRVEAARREEIKRRERYSESSDEDLSTTEEEIEKAQEQAAASLGGEELYQMMVDDIMNMLMHLSEFKDRISQSPLFAHITDRAWQKTFKENFFKFYVDRRSCRHEAGFKQYNIAVNDDGEIDHDIVYAETFTLTFLIMLNEVYKRFQHDAAAQTKHQTSESEFIDLLELFNKNLTAEFSLTLNDIKTKQRHLKLPILSCGSEAELVKTLERAKVQEKHGMAVVLQYGKSASLYTIFAPNFKHEECAVEFFKLYQARVAKGADRGEALCHLVDDIGSAVHLHRDANGRMGIIFAWYEAISHNTVYPILNYP